MNWRRSRGGRERYGQGSRTDCEQEEAVTPSKALTVYVDIEAAGLEIRRPIIQIAAIAVDEELHEVDQFETKIRFDESNACPDALRKIHYRRAEWKRTAVPPKKAAWSFAKFLRRHAAVEIYKRDLSVFRVAQLASHNSQFDGPFLKAWFERLDIFLPASYRVFCTLQRAYWFFQENPQLPLPDDYRLGTLCGYFGVPLNPHEAHDALADVRAAVGLYRAMLNVAAASPTEARRITDQRLRNLG